MANLAESSTWDTVYQLESTDQALAGAGGTMNRQAQALLNRTKFLADTKLNTADFKTQINASGTAPVYAARAWVNFDGVSNPPVIRGSGNVSSITDNVSGKYTVNFITAMQDTTYCVAGSVGRTTTAVNTNNDALSVYEYFTTGVSVYGSDDSAGIVDMLYMNVVVFR